MEAVDGGRYQECGSALGTDRLAVGVILDATRPSASDRKDSTPRYGRLLHPSSWAERDDRDHAADNFFQGGSPKTGHPISPPGPPHRQKSFYAKFPGDEAWMNFRFSRALPPGASRSRRTTGIPSDGRCRAGPLICLGRAGDACVVGALERVGDTLYGARVYVKLGRRLAHAHAARQSCSDSLSQLVRDRRPAKSFTFTLGPL